MEELIAILKNYAPDNIAITPSSLLKEDIMLCSLDFMGVCMEIESRLNKKIDIRKIANALTVQDLWFSLED